MKAAPSLIRRLWLASAILMPILIGFSAFTLNRAFVSSLNSAEYEALLAQIYALIAVAEPNNNHLNLPSALPNPRFETPESGLYARVINEKGNVSWRSNSLETSTFRFPKTAATQPGESVEASWNIGGKNYRALRFTTVWELNDHDTRFTFEVIHSQTSKEVEIHAYQKSLLMWLGGMAILLILIQVVIAIWSLRPLKALATEINNIETGQSHQLEHEYPIEIQPVTHSVNKLLKSETAQRERYKNSLADLAHSLKTPLSVIRSQLEHSAKDQLVDEQIERMSTIISHQLKRANAQVKTVYGPKAKLLEVTQRICSALNKIYQRKGIIFSIEIAPSILCAIANDDLMEVLGNIIENACKYGHSSVKIHANETKENTIINIEDDGDGVTTALKHQILDRGARADTGKLGQGIGLAIAVDILSSYNGSLEIDRSTAGGAVFRMNLPRNRGASSSTAL